MPNWVTNILNFDCTLSTTTPKEIEEFIKGKTDSGGEILFDFNKIIPMPKSLDIEAGSRGETGYRAFADFIEESKGKTMKQKDTLEKRYMKRFDSDPEIWTLGKAYYTNKKRFGCTNWYDWCCANWGTKWNACDADTLIAEDDKHFKIVFNTAWSSPDPVIIALSKHFPDVRITHQYADEDVGFNTGEIEYWGGEYETYDVPSPGSKEAYELAFDILDIDPSEYGFTYDEGEGTYVCR